MKIKNEKTTSVWSADTKVNCYESLKENINIDVCIVGAGITGLTCAYLIAKEGRKVIVVDDGDIGSGESSQTTAHITDVIDDRFQEMENVHGLENLKLIYESERMAILKIKEIINTENIECDYSDVDGYLFFQPGDSANLLEDEYDAAKRAGASPELVTQAPLKDFNTGPCLKYPNQGEFHILKYLNALSEKFITNGGKIFTDTHINKIEENGLIKLVSAKGHIIQAQSVIVATNSPISDYVSIHVKQTAYRTYVIAGKIPKGYVTKALYWDTEEPYHYIRIKEENDFDIIIAGGEDHKTGQDDNMDERFINLEKWTRLHFPGMTSIEYKWSGQVLEPFDGISFIGKDPEAKGNIYIATGDSGMGITHGTYSGIILTDLIMGRENPWSKVYDPGRVKMGVIGKYIAEGVNTAVQFKDYLTPGDINSISELNNNEGAIMRDGLDKIAVYKDNKGEIHKFSAVCPHLKCIVQWNTIEKSWDCPCHGSRFDSLGKVLNGPALTNLEEKE
jgi:glycine/D-amino acid oxidase-like deaminating enzyme/nitrite reductase/ring-hydroxylating ferredoxin subunit